MAQRYEIDDEVRLFGHTTTGVIKDTKDTGVDDPVKVFVKEQRAYVPDGRNNRYEYEVQLSIPGTDPQWFPEGSLEAIE
jgi:hypothetical protein